MANEGRLVLRQVAVKGQRHRRYYDYVTVLLAHHDDCVACGECEFEDKFRASIAEGTLYPSIRHLSRDLMAYATGVVGDSAGVSERFLTGHAS